MLRDNVRGVTVEVAVLNHNSPEQAANILADVVGASQAEWIQAFRNNVPVWFPFEERYSLSRRVQQLTRYGIVANVIPIYKFNLKES